MTDRPMPSMARLYAPMAAVALAVIGVDQLTKAWADDLEMCSRMVKPPTVGFCLAYNEGMAFSFGWGSGAVIAAVAALIVIVLIVMARKSTLGPRLLMGAIAGGAIGNVIDRAFRANAAGVHAGFMKGAVVDFLYSKVWATFNVADSAIVVGGFLLAIALWRMPDPDEPADDPAAPGNASADGPAIDEPATGDTTTSDDSATLTS